MKTYQDAFDDLSQIIGAALEIAQLQRGEHRLQDADTLTTKFVHEVQELREAENIWDEIPDVTYYAVCLLAWGENYRFAELQSLFLEYGVSLPQAIIACKAKYAMRASGPKDIEKERDAIMSALEAL